MKLKRAAEAFYGIRPFGLYAENGRYYFTVDRDCEALSVKLYFGDGTHCREKFSQADRSGGVWRLCLEAEGDETLFFYIYEADGVEFTDEYACASDSPSVWRGKRRHIPRALGECPSCFAAGRSFRYPKPQLAYEDMIVYRLHTRGFTYKKSSGAENRGRFRGIAEKTDYLLGLGINAVELMPPYEFNELMESGRVNYWGFTDDALRMSLKNSFGGPEEFNDLTEELHKNGIELIVDIYFSGRESISYVLCVLRYYACILNVDGIHIIGYADLSSAARDPYLRGVKLWADSFAEYREKQRMSREAANPSAVQIRGPVSGGFAPHGEKPGDMTADYNDGFMTDMRKALKGDEGMMARLADRTLGPASGTANINYIANVNGFNLRDLVSYDHKHNEANGEENLDGTEMNYSWNCGIEGETSGKKVKALRLRQMKNALLLTFLSQGTPLLLCGDEMGHSKKGNNNSYCRDDAVEWTDFDEIKKNREIYEFTKALIAFRKSHKVFRRGERPSDSDSLRTGLPDISLHGESAWRADLDAGSRILGILYNGEYAKDIEGRADDTIFVAYNMHWREHIFSLPDMNKTGAAGRRKASASGCPEEAAPRENSGRRWRRVIDSSLEPSFLSVEENLLGDSCEAAVGPRSIAVFICETYGEV